MKCKICDSALTKNTKSGTCSRSCNAVQQNKMKASKFVPKKCKQCSNEIAIRQSKRVFCSEACQHLWWSGKNHYRWKGFQSHSDGYIVIRDNEHPLADKRGNILQHRIIIEDYLLIVDPKSPFLFEIDGRTCLKPTCVVHHKNGRKNDNRISNLQILENQSEHMKLDNPRKRP